MSTQWNTRGITKSGSAAQLSDAVAEDEVVILMQGKNTFGDRIYSYLKLKLADLKRMQGAILSGQPFSPSDFGSVVAAGKGEPTEEVRAEIATLYRILDTSRMASSSSSSAASAAAPPAPASAPKAWDDY